MALQSSEVLEYKIAACKECAHVDTAPWLWDCICLVTKKTHSKVFAILSKEVNIPGKGLLKTLNDQKLEEDEEEKKTIVRRKWHTDNKKKEWGKQLPFPSSSRDICTYRHEKKWLYNTFKFCLKTRAFH